MKDKEPTSLKAHSQSTHSYPSTLCLPSQTPHKGPHYFPQNVLPDNNDMDQHLNSLPDPPSSPASPPNTLTPTHCEIASPTPPTNLLMTQEFNVTLSVENPACSTLQSDLSNSIHAPGNAMVDQTIGAPPSPPTICKQTAEEDAILAHLTLVEINRSVLSQNGINYCTILPQFTPTPVGGFPSMHMAHSAQIFDHLNNKVLLAWFQVEHPKFIVCVFDHSGKDVAERSAIIMK
ncbi:hypothetical protein BDR07DRAFT_1502118 [Suillus spraguei]|nr:hypothetical protein BDR07DRAFT_1502118 [Suillus spraguei]